MVKFTVPVIGFLCIAGVAQADPVPLSPDLKAFLLRPDQQQVIAEIMTRQWRSIFENCPSPTLAISGVTPEQASTFDQNGVPVSGRWHVNGHAEGCGESRVLGVEYMFTPDGQMRRIGTLPGATVADIALQHDSLTTAMLGMVKLAPQGCKDVRYIDTKFIGFEGTNSGRRPWTEEWTLRSCGVTGIVTMHFTPDVSGPGTSMRSSVNETRPVGP